MLFSRTEFKHVFLIFSTFSLIGCWGQTIGSTLYLWQHTQRALPVALYGSLIALFLLFTLLIAPRIALTNGFEKTFTLSRILALVSNLFSWLGFFYIEAFYLAAILTGIANGFEAATRQPLFIKFFSNQRAKETKNHNKAISLESATLNVSRILGPSTFALLAVSSHFLFTLHLLSTLILIALMIYLLAHSKMHKNPSLVPKKVFTQRLVHLFDFSFESPRIIFNHLRLESKTIYQYGAIWLLSTLLIGLFINPYNNLVTVLLAAKNLDSHYLGYLIAGTGLGAFVFNIFLNQWRKDLLIFGFFMQSVGLFLFSLSHSFWGLFCGSMALGFAAASLIGTVYVKLHRTGLNSSVSSLVLLIYQGSSSFGAFAYGYLLDHYFKIDTLYYHLGLFWLAVPLYFFYLHVQKNPKLLSSYIAYTKQQPRN